MTDDELRALLRTIQKMALEPFLLSPGRNDPVLIYAVGRIAGIATAALEKPSEPLR